MQIFVHFLETIAGMGIAAMGVIGGNGIGDFDSYVKERAVGDQFATLTIRFHDRCQDTLERKTVTGVGEHEQTDRIA